jgi:hypothetical protein
VAEDKGEEEARDANEADVFAAIVVGLWHMVLASIVRMAPAAKDWIRAITSFEAPSRNK